MNNWPQETIIIIIISFCQEVPGHKKIFSSNMKSLYCIFISRVKWKIQNFSAWNVLDLYFYHLPTSLTSLHFTNSPYFPNNLNKVSVDKNCHNVLRNNIIQEKHFLATQNWKHIPPCLFVAHPFISQVVQWFYLSFK